MYLYKLQPKRRAEAIRHDEMAISTAGSDVRGPAVRSQPGVPELGASCTFVNRLESGEMSGGSLLDHSLPIYLSANLGFNFQHSTACDSLYLALDNLTEKEERTRHTFPSTERPIRSWLDFGSDYLH